MGVKPVPCWTIICDWADCGANLLEGSDYIGWGEIDYLTDIRIDSDWHVSRDGDSHYCTRHPAYWASDAEQGITFPGDYSYLLIHDGDTENPGDDGCVTVVIR